MNSENGKTSYSLNLDTKELERDAIRAQSAFESITESARREANKIDSSFANLGKGVASAFAVGSLVEFERKIISVRGEMESLQISFETLAGKQVGRQLYNDIKQFAVTTPMLMGDISKGAQLLLGFGISAEKVMPILRQIGDISMGDAQRFQSLSLAFAQMSSTGKLTGQDLSQMINAGFNPLSIMAEKTGKSISKLKDEMSKGKITVQMVEDAFRSATAEGGKFYGMLEKQSKGVKGALSNLEGAFEDILNDFGEKQQGLLVDGINLATEALKHYEDFGKVLLSVIAAYGSYKTVLLLVAAAQKAMALRDNIQLMMMFRKELGLATAAQQAFNLSLKANPVGLVVSAISGIIAATMLFSSRTKEASEIQQKLNEAFDDTQAKIVSEQKNIDTLFDRLRKAEQGTSDYKKAKDAIINQYGHYLEGLDKEIASLGNVEAAYKAVTRAAREAALARGREAALGEANKVYGETYSASIGKLQDALTKGGVNKGTISSYLRQIQKELRETGTISSVTETKVRDLLRGSFEYGNSANWFKSLRDNERQLQGAIERTDEMFQLDDEKVEASTQNVKKLSQAYTDAEKAYTEAHAKVEDMRKHRDKYTEQEWNDAQEALKTAKKTFEEIGGDPEGKNGKREASEYAKTRKRHNEYLDLQKELADERKRREFDLWADTEQAAIEAMADGSEKTLRQIELDFAQRKEELRRQYEDMRREKFEEDKRLWEADPSHKNTPFTGNISDSRYDLTATESEQLQRKQQALEQQHANMLRDHSRDQIQALYDYLKEYGNIEQKKYAIEKEYDEKIAKEQDANRRRSLEAEKRSQMAKMSAQHIAESIDWGQTFEGVGNVLKGVAQETLKKVDEYMKSDEFRKLNPTDKKAYTDLRQQLVSAGGINSSNPFSGRVWKEIGDAAERYRASVRQLNAANEHAEDVRKRLTKAEEDAAKNPADLGMQQQVNDLKQTFEEANTAVGQAETDVAGAQQDLQTKTQAAAKGIQDFNTVLGQITSGSLSGFATAVGNLIKKIAGSNDEVAKDFGELFGEAGKQIGGIIGVILQLIDILGTEPAKFIDDLLTKIADVLEAVLSQLPEIIASAIKGVGGIIGGVFSGIGNLVAGLFGLGVDNSPYEEAVEKWGWLLDSWEDNLKYERELMEKAYGGDLLTLQKETIDGLKNAQKAAAEIYRGWAGSGAGLFSHSNGYNVNEDTDWWALRNGNPDIYRRMDENVANLFNLDWKELEKLKFSNSKFWQSLHGEAQKYLDQYIEAGKAMVEVQKETWQKLTTTTSDDVFDSFLNSLYDLADGSEDVFEDIAENWQKMVNRMVINNLVGKKFQDRLNSWYESLAKLNEDKTNGQLTDAEYRKRLESLRQQYDSYVESAKRDIETMRSEGIIAATGDNAEAADQSATKKGFATASQDSIDELNGRFAGLMMIAEQSRGMIETSAADIAIIREFHAQHISIAQEIRNLAVLMVSHLEDISKYTKHLIRVDENLETLTERLR